MDWLSLSGIILVLLGAIVQSVVTMRNDSKTDAIQTKLIAAQDSLVLSQAELLQSKRDLDSRRLHRKTLIDEELTILHRRMCQELNAAITVMVELNPSFKKPTGDQNRMLFTTTEIRNILWDGLKRSDVLGFQMADAQVRLGFRETFMYIEPFFPEIPPETVKSIVRALKYEIPTLPVPKKLTGKPPDDFSLCAAIHGQLLMQIAHCADHLLHNAPQYLKEGDPLLQNLERAGNSSGK